MQGRNIKIYNYEAEQKFYLDEELYYQAKGTGLPANSTIIPPPMWIIYNFNDYIPVFQCERWVLRKRESLWFPKIKTVSYELDIVETYSPLKLSYLDFPRYPSFPQILNSSLLLFVLEQKIKEINIKYEQILLSFDEIISNQSLLMSFTPDKASPEFDSIGSLYKYQFLLEELIMHMRFVFDSLVQLNYILTQEALYLQERKIPRPYDSLIAAVSNYKDNKDTTDFEKVLWGKEGTPFKADSNKIDFLHILNDLSNGKKHTMMNAEVYTLLESEPVIRGFYVKNNNHKEVIQHHYHNLDFFYDRF